MIIDKIEPQKTESVTYDENILNFIDYTVLFLVQAQSAEDVDIIMDDFLSDDFIDIMVENKKLFSILAVVWMDLFKRVFISGNESSFSLKVLWIPVIFQKLGWTIEDKASLSEIHTTCLKKANKDDSLYNYLVLLFVEGIFSSLEFASDNFRKNARSIATSDEDIEKVEKLFEDIASLGWPNQSEKPLGTNKVPTSWKFEVSH